MESVILKAGRDRPADALLRDQLRERRMSRRDARFVSAGVFAYYRWREWLNKEVPAAKQIRQALELAERYDREPAQFSEEELLSRSVPPWLAQEMEVTAGFVRAIQKPAVLWLRARSGQGPKVAAALGNTEPAGQGWLADCLRYNGNQDLFCSPEFHQGQFELQDISSQAVGWVCSPGPGQTWWDACAGEGGKTLHLSSLMKNQGTIWASDRAEWRLKKLKRRAARAGVFNYRMVSWDGGAKLPTKTRFDGVLVDAPCSGVGTWGRNPHSRWNITPEDIAEMSQIQSNLLRHVAPALKLEGRLVYAVCTLTQRETDDVADAFEREYPDFLACNIEHPYHRGVTARRLRLQPEDKGGNGMFIAVWKRVT